MSNKFKIKFYWNTAGTDSMNKRKVPIMKSSVGGLIPVLDAVLVNGFGEASVSVRIDANDTNRAIVTETGHGYAKHCRIALSGCADEELNGEFEIVGIVDDDRFVIDLAGVAHSVAAGESVAGTITAKVPSLGWTKEFAGTNTAVYRMGGGNRRYLWVDDSTTNSVNVKGAFDAKGVAEADLVDAFFPSSSYIYWTKRTYSTAGGGLSSNSNVAWTIVGSDRFFYLSVAYSGDNTLDRRNSRLLYAFGDVNAYNEFDECATIISSSSTDYTSFWYNTSNYMAWAGTFTNQRVSDVRGMMLAPFGEITNDSSSSSSSSAFLPRELMPENDIIPIATPVLLYDSSETAIRAEMPGIAGIATSLNGTPYYQNRIIAVNGMRYIVMGHTSQNQNVGCFLLQIDGDMHELKGVI